MYRYVEVTDFINRSRFNCTDASQKGTVLWTIISEEITYAHFARATRFLHHVLHLSTEHHHHHHVPGLLQTSAIMAFQPSLLSVLLMSSLLGESLLVTKLFRLSVYFVHCLPLLLVPQIFPLIICWSSPSTLFICPLKLQLSFSDGLEYGSFVSSHLRYFFVYFFSVHDILIILPMYHISAASSLIFRSFVDDEKRLGLECLCTKKCSFT